MKENEAMLQIDVDYDAWDENYELDEERLSSVRNNVERAFTEFYKANEHKVREVFVSGSEISFVTDKKNVKPFSDYFVKKISKAKFVTRIEVFVTEKKKIYDKEIEKKD